MKRSRLDVSRHDRDAAGMTYVYPVVSRRSEGVSVGINLNVNNACNWRCVYCQVPGLKRGGPPPVDLDLLADELRRMLVDILRGGFMDAAVPPEMRRLNDIALSGNGEPTSAAEFPAVVDRIGMVMEEYSLIGRVKLVLISNGSLLHKSHVREGLARMRGLGGEVWFKLDRATREGFRAVNHTDMTPDRAMRNLAVCAGLCPTWIQTCAFSVDGSPPPEPEVEAYLAFLNQAREAGIPLRGVLLYGLARPSAQPEAPRLGNPPAAWMDALAGRITHMGYPCRVFT